MSRNRMIKSEFWTSEQVLSCSIFARLLFIGLWNFADDNGVHPASYVKIKAEVFPADPIEINRIEGLIEELIQQGLLKQYEVDAKRYWIVTGWKTHQKIDKPTYRYPMPQFNEKLISSSSDFEGNLGIVAENSVITHRELVDDYANGSDEIEKKEKRKGKEKHLSEVKTSPFNLLKLNHDGTELFEYWQQTMNHPQAKLDKKRKRAIVEALKLGYNALHLQQAIDGCKNTPYNMGKNENGQVYDDISLIFRDAEHIERFIRNADNSSERCANNTNDLMAGVL